MYDHGWTFLVGAVPLFALVAATVPFRPVGRRRTATFVFRELLELTAANAGQVVAYLATVRRWRAGGLLVAIFVQLWIEAPTLDRRVNIDLAWIFVGWFAGAVVAEWRVSALQRSGPRRAALRRRVLVDYVGRRTTQAVVGLWLVVGALGAAGLLDTATSTNYPLRPIVFVLAVFAVLGVVLVVVVRQVLARPQPPAEPDRVAADDAIRSRSLRALAGAAVAIAGYLAAALLAVVPAEVHGIDASDRPLAVFVALTVLPLCGLLIATAPRRVRRRERVATA